MEMLGGSRPSADPGPRGVKIETRTWARESHDLFDFEASQIQSQTISVNNSVKLVRSGAEIQALEDREAAGEPPAEPLLRIVQRGGNYWVDKSSHGHTAKKLWSVVRELPSGGHKLGEGDVIKLGRVRFRVRQLVATESEGLRPELLFLDDQGPRARCEVPADHVEKLSSTTCRICLLEGSAEEDPLISPCQCKGSVEHVHLGCLRHWLRERLRLPDSESNPTGSYIYRPQICELCRTSYPSMVNFQAAAEAPKSYPAQEAAKAKAVAFSGDVPPEKGGTQVPLMEVPKTAAPFIVLESQERDKDRNQKSLHVVSLADKPMLKFGRGHESTVRIADVSISRCHAIIRFNQEEGTFILEDNNSKFGTLVQMRRTQPLGTDNVSIQVGRTVLSLSVPSLRE